MNVKIRYKLVFNRSGKLNKRGEGLIEIEASQQKKRKYFTTHTYCYPNEFSNGRIVNRKNSEKLNYALLLMIRDTEDIELEFIKNGVLVNLELLKESIKNNTTPSAKLIDFGAEVVKSSDRQDKTKDNYKTLFNDLEKFRKGLLLSDVDYPCVLSYEKYLNKNGLSKNTLISRMRMLRAIINEAKKRELIKSDPFLRYKISGMESKKGYLKYDELIKLENLELCGFEEKVRDLFLIGCYTGLRFSDIITLGKKDFDGEWIVKKMKKTKNVVEIPYKRLFNGRMVMMIEKYKNIEKLTKNIGDNSKVNCCLHKLFIENGFNGNLTFHSSRHTCATLLSEGHYPDFKKIDNLSISKILGHKDPKITTRIYIESNREMLLNSL